MNRRIRSRTYGGVRGREPSGSLLLDWGGADQSHRFVQSPVSIPVAKNVFVFYIR